MMNDYMFSILFVLLDLTLQEIKVLKKFHLICGGIGNAEYFSGCGYAE